MNKAWCVLVGVLLVSAQAHGFDLDNGANVYEESQCVSCHAGGFGNKATDYQEVLGWVRRCNGNFGAFFPEDEPDVAAYLAKEYYGYPVPDAPDAEASTTQ